MDKKFVDVHLVECDERVEAVLELDPKDILINSYNVFLTRQHLLSRKMVETVSMTDLIRKNRELEIKVYHYEAELKSIKEELVGIKKILGVSQDFSSFDPDEYFTEEEISDILDSISEIKSGRFQRYSSAKSLIEELHKKRK